MESGFIGKIEIDGENSTVLVTNYHVIIGGLPEDIYKKAKKVTEDMKKAIEVNARRSEIEVCGKRFNLSGGMLVEGTSKLSSDASVCL